MSSSTDIKQIKGESQTVWKMLANSRYGLDFYQREYTWTEVNVAELVTDLTSSFLEDYRPEHERKAVAEYRPYFLGPVVTNRDGDKRNLVDGQQRLTTLTLLIMYLAKLSADREDAPPLTSLVYSSMFGTASFNIDVEDRTEVMEAIRSGSDIDLEKASDSARNIWARYQDIAEKFPDEVAGDALLYFVDWLLYRVVLVEINTDDADMALEIFETMNDRGLQLSNTDMFKSFILSQIKDQSEIEVANHLWRARIDTLNATEKNADSEFIKLWLRGKYAETIREGKKDAVPLDFDVIGTAFHKWTRDNRELLGLHDPTDYRRLVNHDFKRLSDRYLQLLSSASRCDPDLPAVYFNAHNGLTLQFLPVMAAVTPDDDDASFRAKTRLISDYLDLMLVRRMANTKNFGYSTLKSSIFGLSKELRNKDVDEVRVLLADRAAGLDETLDGLSTLRLSMRNRGQIAYLLARMTSWMETWPDDRDTNRVVGYLRRDVKDPYEVEHIWARHYERHSDEYTNEYEFLDARDRFGGLLLLPKSFNASYGDLSYEEKLPHYLKNNLLAASLHPTAYSHNPNFDKLRDATGLKFKAHPGPRFTKEEQAERQELYKAICGCIWSPEALGLGGGTAPSVSRDFYTSFGESEYRRWSDGRKYGFVSAGGGRWYTASLSALKPGDRVFAYVPGHGYVGVGEVTGSAVPASNLMVQLDGQLRRLRDVPIDAPMMWQDEHDPERAERAVGIRWLATRSVEDAIPGTGLFSNQHSACRLSDATTKAVVLEQLGLG